MNKKIIEHFKKRDPVIYSVIPKIQRTDLFVLPKSNDYFLSLCREIINQQLGDKAAHAIFTRFLNLFPNQNVTAQHLLDIPEDTIRGVGPSWAKVRFLKGLAQKVVTREVVLENLEQLDDQSIMTELTKIKGIGIWTAEMFLMFALGRQDVFSYSDLGLRKAIKKLYRLKSEPTKEEALTVSSPWSPYRTYASRILWESLEI